MNNLRHSSLFIVPQELFEPFKQFMLEQHVETIFKTECFENWKRYQAFEKADKSGNMILLLILKPKSEKHLADYKNGLNSEAKKEFEDTGWLQHIIDRSIIMHRIEGPLME